MPREGDADRRVESWLRHRYWLLPGVGIKRWLAAVVAGVLVCGFGFALILNVEVLGYLERRLREALAPHEGWMATVSLLAGIGLVLLGAGTGVYGLRRAAKALVEAVWSGNSEELAQRLYQGNQLQRGPRLVVIGGGTGLSALLRGLKHHTRNITAIVTVADDGGSSGRLREELGILPPGDIRNTLVALADTEPLMEKLFQHRFQRGEGLQGHSFGNLFIASLTEVTGDFERAVRESSRVLAVRGRVLPSTLDNVRLRATYTDGSRAEGESRIAAAGKEIRRLELVPADARPLPEAITAIEEADAIIIGPGSLFTSVLPNLLIPELTAAIRRSRARKIFVCNIMTQPGETDGFTASRHLEVVKEHVGHVLVDTCIVNVQPVSAAVLRRYREDGAYPVRVDADALKKLGVRCVAASLLEESEVVRHHPARLAEVILEQIPGRGER